MKNKTNDPTERAEAREEFFADHGFYPTDDSWMNEPARDSDSQICHGCGGPTGFTIGEMRGSDPICEHCERGDFPHGVN